MTEQELRALVRDAISAQLGRGAPPPAGATPAAFLREHPSHGLFSLPPVDSQCIIEPAVTCNHCGYCKSYGH